METVLRRQSQLSRLPDAALTGLTYDLRDRLADGTPEAALAGETFSLVRESARRRLGIEHRDNQLQAAWHLLQRKVVELPTGEGKTLAATPALSLRALHGRGVWLATANDYLARRDALTMQPVFELLGLSTGFVQALQPPADRRQAYACDVTYGTIREFGFDFLRDRLARHRGGGPRVEQEIVQRERFSIFVDEADSILLDDARTPLIISEPRAEFPGPELFPWAVAASRMLQDDVDYLTDPHSPQVWLTNTGRAKVRNAARPEVLALVSLPEAYESVTKAVQAERTFHLNRDYVIRDGKIVIVDRLTGRLAEGRQWQNGIQQVLQAANDLEITPDTNSVARITIQAFLRGFQHLSGMTGTAREAARELSHIYGLGNIVLPPHRPSRREEWPVQIRQTRQEKWQAVVASIQALKQQRRPVLIGTRDLHASEELSDRLRREGIDHQVLTARQEAEEADVIARAGGPGMITVSTNIAGRGVDIRLDPGVVELGGLHVIAADMFDAARIDRQLAGRGGRQGDPTTYQRILSLEDDLLPAAWDEQTCQRQIQRVKSGETSEKLALQRLAQQRLERQHTAARQALLTHDRQRIKRNQDLGFDPYLDDPES